uniref:HIT domain-containing protein n=1 Tax=Manihot esculenta TaxID=3983 RepID=A0A2C9WI72_MANES
MAQGVCELLWLQRLLEELKLLERDKINGVLDHVTSDDQLADVFTKGLSNKTYHTLREVKRFADLTVDETSDLWFMAQKIGSRLEGYHQATSLTFTIQDGPQAGQTVPHVHIHILPRKSGDFENNDEIYDAIDVKEKELKQKLDLDKERKDRSIEEMAQEAEAYRSLFF